jgi:hypothetical protein
MAILIVLLVYLSSVRRVHAYLDPGTGSYVFQLLMAGLLGGTFFFRSAVKRMIRKFMGKDGKRNDPKDR